MGLVSALKSVQNLSKQKIELDKQILRIQQKAKKIGPSAGKFPPNLLQKVAENADQFVPSTSGVTKKVGSGLKQKIGNFFHKMLENYTEYVNTVRRNYKMK